jgi:cation:H+ antiporter
MRASNDSPTGRPRHHRASAFPVSFLAPPRYGPAPLSSLAAIQPSPLLQNPLFLLGLFIGGSLLMIWRLELMTQRGVEGTVLGTLVMPYCSGIGNLIFALVAHRSAHLSSAVVVENSLVNNVTNMTLLIGLPAILWGVSTRRSKPNRKRKEVTAQRLNRLSIFLTLTAVLFFTGITYALGMDDGFSKEDGYVLVGLFLFWQCFHVYDVLKTNVRERRSLSWLLALDFLLLLLGGFDVYYSIEGLVAWIERDEQSALKTHAGWLSGWLMVLPNALLALYYGWRRKPEVIYTSQIGDGHICIPLCIGIAAILNPLTVPSMFDEAMLLLGIAVAIHFAVVSFFGQLPRFAGIILTLMYIGFVVKGFGSG